jgi:hypothetical protein
MKLRRIVSVLLKAKSSPRWGKPIPLFNGKDLTGWKMEGTGTTGWITVVQNSQTIINNKEIPGITGGALDSHEELPGPIYFQGSEKGHVAYRSIVITPAQK